MMDVKDYPTKIERRLPGPTTHWHSCSHHGTLEVGDGHEIQVIEQNPDFTRAKFHELQIAILLTSSFKWAFKKRVQNHPASSIMATNNKRTRR